MMFGIRAERTRPSGGVAVQNRRVSYRNRLYSNAPVSKPSSTLSIAPVV